MKDISVRLQVILGLKDSLSELMMIIAQGTLCLNIILTIRIEFKGFVATNYYKCCSEIIRDHGQKVGRLVEFKKTATVTY